MTKEEQIEVDIDDVDVMDGVIPTRNATLTGSFCAEKHLGKVKDSISYTNYQDDNNPEKIKLDFEISMISAARKGDLRAISYDRHKDDAIAMQVFEDEITIAEALGLNHADIVQFKLNKPTGVWETLSYIVQMRLGAFGMVEQSKVEEAKNTEGQD